MKNTDVTEFVKTLENLYVEKNFKELKEKLIENKNLYGKGHFHFNLGTVNLKEGNFPVAKYHFELAKKSGYIYPELYKNDDSLNMQLADQGILTFEKIEPKIIDTIKGTDIFISVLVCLLIATALAIFHLKKKTIQKGSLALISAIVMAIPALAYLIDRNYQQAVVIESSKVFEGPSKVYQENSTLSGGEKVILSKNDGPWFFIKYPHRLRGWVNRSGLGFYR